ncbi:large subunit ribosomal protein L23 [Caldalkalibacillus uzonensis]|uniref:Large ribosomal subunit protein uL23 n=1 Tax=Caldalkalibacillus uzonensis TaxID=353224 RepID=A0ABU0CVQ5_9BACI|nr:50S ribosomal protein L23 [Caldalkalibacillus uzonensis]MDQ0340188.1 large subunit ribosomal protein L23 [Caldalkalibacillus uzonensis]
MKDPRDIIKRPIITERSTDMMEQNKYVFEVDVKANKTEIKKAVEQIFDVKVVKVNTINMKKKPKRFGRFSGFTPRRKKAIVQLSEDSKPLEFFEGA